MKALRAGADNSRCKAAGLSCELQVWMYERIVKRKQRLRDLFLSRHSDEDIDTAGATTLNWYDSNQ